MILLHFEFDSTSIKHQTLDETRVIYSRQILQHTSCACMKVLLFLPSAASKNPFVSKRGGAISDVNVQLAVTLHPAGGGVTGGGGGGGFGGGGGGGPGGAGSFGRIR